MGAPAAGVRDRRAWAYAGPDAVWVVSPHRLVAQAVCAALSSTGAPVEFHAWEHLVDASPRGAADEPTRYVLAIFEGGDPPDAIDDIGRLVALGGLRVAVVTPASHALLWGGILEDPALDVVTMTTSVVQLADVVDRFVAGESLMELETRENLRSDWCRALDKQQRVAEQVRTLSPQQLRVLGFLAAGRRVPEVAQLMGITDGTVRSHVKSLRAKLGASTQLEAVAMLREVYEVGAGADLVPRPRSAPSLADKATIDVTSLGVSRASVTTAGMVTARR